MKSYRVIVALDNMDKQQCFTFLSSMSDDLKVVKIGLEMFNRYGPDFVQEVFQTYNKRIFLDLKLHDIPNTVAKSLYALKDLPIDFLTVHLTGGRAMLEKCQEVRNEVMPNLTILGVSYLTSLGKEDFAEIYNVRENQIVDQFHALFTLAQETKTQGVVCSAHELEIVKNYDLLTVCPGIRFSDEIHGGQSNDQKRVLPPELAFQAGADYLVMGRSLTQAQSLDARVKQLNQ